MPALDTIALKATMMESMHQDWWRSYLELEHKDVLEQDPTNEVPYRVTARELTSQIHRSLALAENFYVTPDMQVLVTAAAEVTDDEEIVRFEDFPCEAGFLVIPGGLAFIDHRLRIIVTTAVLWHIYGGVVDLHYITDKSHPVVKATWNDQGEYGPNSSARWERLPQLMPWVYAKQDLNDTVGLMTVTLGLIPPEISRQIRIEHNENGDVIMLAPIGFMPDEMVPHPVSDPIMKWLLACLRLMRQEITSVTERGLPANVRKRMGRSVRMRNTHVTVIEYRRREAWHGPEGSGREFSHRFFRRGHMRRQPHKNPDGTWGYHLVYIHPTIVGDPSKPLLLREHVNALMR
jgi:hypothetical protein